jgi:hypothetical protein
MIEIWYVVFVLLGLNGEAVTAPQFMSGPYPSSDECVAAGKVIDYPTDAQVMRVVPGPGSYVVSVGCIQIDTDPKPEPDVPGDKT